MGEEKFVSNIFLKSSSSLKSAIAQFVLMNGLERQDLGKPSSAGRFPDSLKEAGGGTRCPPVSEANAHLAL